MPAASPPSRCSCGPVVTYGGYGLAGLVLVAYFWRTLRHHRESWILALALVGSGLSVLLDLSGIDSDLRRVAEEMAKMVGAAALVAFPAMVLSRSLAAPGQPDAAE